jgi:hypothetical protein
LKTVVLLKRLRFGRRVLEDIGISPIIHILLHKKLPCAMAHLLLYTLGILWRFNLDLQIALYGGLNLNTVIIPSTNQKAIHH